MSDPADVRPVSPEVSWRPIVGMLRANGAVRPRNRGLS